MTRKVTSIRIDHGRGKLSMRAQSKSLNGTGFTVRGVKLEGDFIGAKAVKTALAEGFLKLFPE